MRRCTPLLLCLASCGYLGYDAQNVIVSDAGPDADAADADTTCTARPTADYCTSLPWLERAPVLDGEVDCGLALSSFSPSGWYQIGSEPMPTDVSTRYAAAWREDGLYVYFEVVDPGVFPAAIVPGSIYCGDAAEIYVDSDGTLTSPPAYDASGTRQFISRAPEDGVAASIGESFANQSRIASWRNTGFLVSPRVDGYALEAFITRDDMGLAQWTLAAGGRVGFDLGLNVSTADGSPNDCDVRLGQFFLRSVVSAVDPCYGRPYCDATAFCTPTLLAP